MTLLPKLERGISGFVRAATGISGTRARTCYAAGMTREEFSEALAASRPPAGLSAALRVLWLDAKGDWVGAHELAQTMEDTLGARLHAYLHRKEGDLANARYWYREAGRPLVATSLEAEWSSLLEELLPVSR